MTFNSSKLLYKILFCNLQNLPFALLTIFSISRMSSSKRYTVILTSLFLACVVSGLLYVRFIKLPTSMDFKNEDLEFQTIQKGDYNHVREIKNNC
jgi:hypothetical protein